jgi:membrane protease YdiL (CAAX protease family)
MDETPSPELLRAELPRWSWSAGDLFVFIGFFCVSLVVLPALSVAIAGIFRPGISLTDLPGEIQILIQAVLDFVWVGFIFFLIKVVHRQPIRESIHWIPTSRYRKLGLIALGVLMSVAVSLASSLFLPKTPLPIEKLAESTRSLVFLAMFGMFVAPIMEEIMFRGFFFTVLCDLTSPRVAVPVTALLFALLHAPQLWGSWAAVGLIFVLGYVLSLARHRTNSLIPSFIIHTAYNSTLFGVSVIGALLEHGK